MKSRSVLFFGLLYASCLLACEQLTLVSADELPMFSSSIDSTNFSSGAYWFAIGILYVIKWFFLFVS